MNRDSRYVDDVGCCHEPVGAWWRIGLTRVERYCLKCGTSLYVISSSNDDFQFTGRTQEVLA